MLIWGPEDMREDVRGVILTAVAGAIAALGLSARDDRVSSEGTDAALRRRNPQHPMDP